jgi:hypothetical protein
LDEYRKRNGYLEIKVKRYVLSFFFRRKTSLYSTFSFLQRITKVQACLLERRKISYQYITTTDRRKEAYDKTNRGQIGILIPHIMYIMRCNTQYGVYIMDKSMTASIQYPRKNFTF